MCKLQHNTARRMHATAMDAAACAAGFGGCFNVTAADVGTVGDCTTYASNYPHIMQAARLLCPAVTFVQQCWLASNATPYSCAGDSQIEHMSCVNATSCSAKVGPDAQDFAHQTCECRPTEWYELDWYDSACYDSPYYAPIVRQGPP